MLASVRKGTAVFPAAGPEKHWPPSKQQLKEGTLGHWDLISENWQQRHSGTANGFQWVYSNRVRELECWDFKSETCRFILMIFHLISFSACQHMAGPIGSHRGSFKWGLVVAKLRKRKEGFCRLVDRGGCSIDAAIAAVLSELDNSYSFKDEKITTVRAFLYSWLALKRIWHCGVA